MTGTAPTIAELAPSRIVPVVVIEDAAQAEALREALKTGGLNCAEVTFRTQAAAEAMRIMAEDPDFTVGAGTVVTSKQVDDAVTAGARFVVSPGVSSAVVSRCTNLGIPVYPGVITPSEVIAAMDLGLSVLKFFPAGTAGGVPALKALGGPFGAIRFIPTGGITAANAGEYLSLSNVAAIGGSWLTPASALREGNFAEVTRLTAEAVALAQKESP
jgi:2-dehydro-3-deoxyphosphogluconate aldolase / (4S)-4-hydroxy-2-oxoglutarate aldolase